VKCEHEQLSPNYSKTVKSVPQQYRLNPTCAGPYLCGSRWLNLRSERGGRSQRRAVMSCGEEADQRYSPGWHSGLKTARSSAPTAQRLASSCEASVDGYIRLPHWRSRVIRAVKVRKWKFVSTIEVPRCLVSRPLGRARVISRYKVVPKRESYAVVHVTHSLRHVVKGCQPGQSSALVVPCPIQRGRETLRMKGQSSVNPLLLPAGRAVSPVFEGRADPGSASRFPTHGVAKQHSSFRRLSVVGDGFFCPGLPGFLLS
jgi:hypothetical protein